MVAALGRNYLCNVLCWRDDAFVRGKLQTAFNFYFNMKKKIMIITLKYKNICFYKCSRNFEKISQTPEYNIIIHNILKYEQSAGVNRWRRTTAPQEMGSPTEEILPEWILNITSLALPDINPVTRYPYITLFRWHGIYLTLGWQSFSLQCGDDNHHPRSCWG